MVSFLELTLAQKLAEANGQKSHIPSELMGKNFYMDDAVMQRIESVKKEFDVLDDMDDKEKTVISSNIVYARLKKEQLSNPFLRSHIDSFKSAGSFVGYYKKKFGHNKLDEQA